MRKMGGGGGSWPGIKTCVISRTLQQRDHPKMTIAQDGATLVTDLKAEAGKDIWLFGGGELFRSLMSAGLVDAVDVAIVQVLLGGGIQLLQQPVDRSSLKLTTHRVYEKSGIVGLEYDVVRKPARRK